jgi:ABC-type sugar transport system substrate-binding protein
MNHLGNTQSKGASMGLVKWRHIGGTAAAVTLVALMAAVLSACGGSGSSGSGKMLPGTEKPLSSKQALDQTVEFLESNAKPKEPYKIGYIAECYANNPYCEAKYEGVEAAAKKFGASVKIYDANFSAGTQLKQVQEAINEGFDGYVFGPAVASLGCQMWKKYLQPTEKPVATEDIPMCGDKDWTPGTVGFTAFQTQANINAELEHDVEVGCEGKPCEILSLSGFLGSDLFNMWSKATEEVVANMPGVTLAEAPIPAEFSAPLAYEKVAAILKTHPNISVILSQQDEMSVGIIRAIRAAGKVPGTDIKVFSQGGPKTGIEMIERGEATGTTELMPYQEGEYATAQVLRYLIEGKATPGWVNLKESPKILNGPGSVYITKANASKAEPEY